MRLAKEILLLYSNEFTLTYEVQKWQMGHFKLPRMESPHFQMGGLSAAASGL